MYIIQYSAWYNLDQTSNIYVYFVLVMLKILQICKFNIYNVQ